MNISTAAIGRKMPLYFDDMTETIIGIIDSNKIIMNKFFRYDEGFNYYVSLLIEAKLGCDYCILELGKDGLKRIILCNVLD